MAKHGGWPDRIGIWFNVLQRGLLRGGKFKSKKDLSDQLLRHLNYYDARWPHPTQSTYTGRAAVA